MHRMRIRDVELAVEQTGAGPLMLWGHGLTSSRANENARRLWDLSEAVPAAGFELVRYDARGHGQSGGAHVPSTYGWSSLADDAIALLEALEPTGPAVLGGASMGAATMLHAAVRRPAAVRALVLVIPPTAWETRLGQRAIYEGAAGFVRAKGKQAYLDAIADLPPLPIFAEHPEFWTRDVDISEALLADVLEGAAASDLPSLDEISALTMPTLILPWADDPGHPVSTAEALHRVMPNSTLEIAGTVDKVKQWGTRVAEFLRSL